MDHSRHDLASSEAFAVEAARHWGLELGPSFALSTVSYVAPAGDLVVKVAWGGDDESLHEPDALELWGRRWSGAPERSLPMRRLWLAIEPGV